MLNNTFKRLVDLSVPTTKTFSVNAKLLSKKIFVSVRFDVWAACKRACILNAYKRNALLYSSNGTVALNNNATATFTTEHSDRVLKLNAH